MHPLSDGRNLQMTCLEPAIYRQNIILRRSNSISGANLRSPARNILSKGGDITFPRGNIKQLGEGEKKGLILKIVLGSCVFLLISISEKIKKLIFLVQT